MVADTILLDKIQFLPELPAVICRDRQLFIDHNSGDALAGTAAPDPGFLIIQEESTLPQFLPDKGNHALWIEIPGEGHVVTISGISDSLEITAPPKDFIKLCHDNIGDGRRTGSALGQGILVVAQHGQQNAQGFCVNLGGEYQILYIAIADRVKEMENVQLQHHALAYMVFGVADGAAAGIIRLGIAGNGSGENQDFGDLVLDGFQQFIRNPQFTVAAAFLRNCCRPVMLVQAVADCVKGLGGEPQVLFQGGKLPVYDHVAFLPFPVWNNTMLYDEVRSGIPEHTQVCGNTASSSAERSEYGKVCKPAATRSRCQVSGVHYCSKEIIAPIPAVGKKRFSNK